MSKKEKPHKNKKWLIQKYRVERLSMNEIAELCGCSKMTISRALNEHGIESRSSRQAMILKRVKRECFNRPLEKYDIEYLKRLKAEEGLSFDDIIEEDTSLDDFFE